MKKNLMFCFLLLAFSASLFGGGQKKSAADANDPDAWPTKPINMICPWSAGGIADLAIRTIAEYGEEYFGEPIVPVVKTGAGGAVALTEFIRYKANEPYIQMASEGLFAITPLTNKVAWKWEDVVPVIGVTYSAFSLIVSSESGITTLDDLVAKGKEEKITIAITGDNLLFVAAFAAEAGIDYEAVPYSGAPDAIAAVLSGDVTVGVSHPALAKEHIKAGTVSAIACFDDEPWVDDVMNIPPVTDFGYTVVFPNHNFLIMPGGTDQAIIDKVHEKISAIFEEPDFIALAKKLDLTIRPTNRAEIQAHIDNAITKAKEYSVIANNS